MAEPRGINISSGIGTGEAQILNTPQTDRALWRQMELRKQNEKVKKDEFYENLAKIDTKGLKVQDIPKFEKLREDIISTRQKLEQSRDRSERIKLRTELEQAKSKFELQANRSKQAAEFDKALATEAFKNWDSFDDETRAKIQRNMILSSDDPSYKMDFLEFTPQAKDVDLSKVFERVDEVSLTNKGKSILPADATGFNKIIEDVSWDDNKAEKSLMVEYSNNRKIQGTYARKFGLLTEDQKNKIGSPFNLFFAEYLDRRPQAKGDEDFRSQPRTNVNVNVNSGGGVQAKLPDPAEGARRLNIKTYNTKGGVSTSVLPVTSRGGFVFKPLSLQVAKSSSLRDAETLEPIGDVGTLELSVGDIQLVPTYKAGTKLSSGKDVSGMPIPDDKLENANKNKAVVYDVVAYAKDASGNTIFGNANQLIEQAINLAESGKEDKAYLNEILSVLGQRANELNGVVSKTNTPKTSAPTPKKAATQKGKVKNTRGI